MSERAPQAKAASETAAPARDRREEAPDSCPEAGHGEAPLDRVWQSWTPACVPSLRPGLSFVPSGPEGWRRIGLPGIRVKPLSVDADRRYVTMLVSMDPGASYPRHRHAGREECYVLQGELRVGEERLGEGDYQIAEAGSVHEEQATDVGCLLLIVSSQQDELLS